MNADKTKIYLLMASACIDIAELQKVSNMPRSTLNKVISEKSVRPITIGKLAKALCVDVEDILKDGT